MNCLQVVEYIYWDHLSSLEFTAILLPEDENLPKVLLFLNPKDNLLQAFNGPAKMDDVRNSVD